jgi:hypothetical protein
LDRYFRSRFYHLLLVYDAPQDLKRRLEEIMEEYAGVSFFYFCRLIVLLAECEAQGGAMMYLPDTAAHDAAQRLINAFLTGIPQGHEKGSIDTLTIAKKNEEKGNLPPILSDFLKELDPQRYVEDAIDGQATRLEPPDASAPEAGEAAAAVSTSPSTSKAREPLLPNEFAAYKQWLLLAPPGLIIGAEAMRVFCELFWQSIHARGQPPSRTWRLARSDSPASAAYQLLSEALPLGVREVVCAQSSLPSPLGVFLRRGRPSRESADSRRSGPEATQRTDFLVEVRNEIDRCFNEAELKDLCFELGVEYENLEGARKTDKVRDLVTQMERMQKMDALLEACKRKVPRGRWPTAPPVQMSSTTRTPMDKLVTSP